MMKSGAVADEGDVEEVEVVGDLRRPGQERQLVAAAAEQ
jgi:hypothetical protein